MQMFNQHYREHVIFCQRVNGLMTSLRDDDKLKENQNRQEIIDTASALAVKVHSLSERAEYAPEIMRKSLDAQTAFHLARLEEFILAALPRSQHVLARGWF